MADRPIATPLPADLPENWTVGQIVSPDGTDVGLSEKHGYNYLMQMVNRAQQGVNSVNEAFDTVSGKRTCRFVVGSSTAGWTEADCDFLCDGEDDQTEINQAITELPFTGGEIVLLSGTYHLSGPVVMAKQNTVLRGNGASTVLRRESAEGSGSIKSAIVMGPFCELLDLSYNGGGLAADGSYEIAMSAGGSIRNVAFAQIGWSCIYVEGTGGSGHKALISGCTCDDAEEFIRVKSGYMLAVRDNLYSSTGGIFLKTDAGSNVRILAVNNFGFVIGLYFVLDGLSPTGMNVISGNTIATLQMLNTQNTSMANAGNLVCGNIFFPPASPSTTPYAILLGENTSGIFVTENMLLDKASNKNYTIQDLGSNNIVRFNSDDPGGSTPETVQQAVPVITVSPDGRVVASAAQQAGYVAAGTRSAAVQLSSAQDPDFAPENIKDGVSVFGVTGTLQSGGEAAGVSSFNGRDGAVMPADDDYTAAMVGARPDTWTPTAADVGAIANNPVSAVSVLTEAEYSALTQKDATTLYLVKE